MQVKQHLLYESDSDVIVASILIGVVGDVRFLTASCKDQTKTCCAAWIRLSVVAAGLLVHVQKSSPNIISHPTCHVDGDVPVQPDIPQLALKLSPRYSWRPAEAVDCYMSEWSSRAPFLPAVAVDRLETGAFIVELDATPVRINQCSEYIRR